MSAYTGSGTNYPLPLPNIHGTASSDGPPHHGLPMLNHSYQYDAPPPHQQLQSPYGNGHSTGHLDGQQQPQQQQQQHNSPVTPSGNGSGDGQKGNRLRKACDSCSIRKVKCDESGPPCRACAALDIPCTFERPSRRRGPPNKHAEAFKKRKLEADAGGSFSSPTSPTNAAATLVTFSSHPVLGAESICPLPVLELLVDDFFTYIHPLCPFPHEPSFRDAFKHRQDLSNPNFLALLASMVGVLVASFPRKPRLHLKAQHREHLFPNSMSLVDQCHRVAVEARGAGYLDKELSIYDAATSYFLGLARAYTFQWRQTRLYFGETLTIARVIGAHKLKDTDFLPVGGLPPTYGGENNAFKNNPPPPVDFIKQEISRRIFWVMFVGIRSMQQLGATFGELLIPPPTPNEPYPPLPLEVDDEYIFVDHIEPQPPGIISKLKGFNLGIQIYNTVTPLATMELAYGIDQVFDINRQKQVLETCLQQCKDVLDRAPPELLLTPGSKPGEFQGAQYPSPMPEYPGMRANGSDSAAAAKAKRELQFEIQKANIYASQLGTRSYIVEKYWGLTETNERIKANSGVGIGSPGVIASGLDSIMQNHGGTSHYDGIKSNISNERESIVKDLLTCLGSISQENMEPNGGSFVRLLSSTFIPQDLSPTQVNKVRQIASTLIDTPQNRKGPLAVKAEDYLGKFLDMLMKLERISPGVRGGSQDGGEDEEEALRKWADIREYQMRFMQAGGFLNEI